MVGFQELPHLNIGKNFADKVYCINSKKSYKKFLSTTLPEINKITSIVEILDDVQRIKIKFDYITLFHVLEHIKDPVSILSTLSNMLNDNGKIIIEVPNSQEALICLYESDAYRKFIYWSQHLYLFNEENLISLTEKSNLRLEEIKQIQRYPISNHLYWLACGKPDGHKELNYMDSISLNNEYQKQLSKLKACDTLLGVFTK